MEFKFNAAIEKVSVKLKEIDGHEIKAVEMTFGCLFEPMIARAISGEAPTVLLALENHGLDKAVIPIDAVDVRGVLRNSSTDEFVAIARLRGITATGTAGNAEDGSPPWVSLKFSALWTREAWVFLGEFHGAYVEIDLADRQTSLPLVVPAEAKAKTPPLLSSDGMKKGRKRNTDDGGAS